MTSISVVRNAALAARLNAAAPAVVAFSEALDRAAREGTVHQIATATIVAPDLTVEEMGKVYTQRMAKNGAPGRAIYDEIFSSPPHGRCPLCAQRSVSTLDHYLPKAHYPALVVSPNNLIPSCHECNKAKLDRIPIAPEEVCLSPYYDDLGAEIWLAARVVEIAPGPLRFGIVAPDNWSELLKNRVLSHFRLLGLAKLYASEASEELLNIQHQLRTISASAGSEAVRAELDVRAQSCALARPNGWRAAAYSAWRDSDWFCNGGFLPLPA